MNKSIGIVELIGSANAIFVVDKMLKAASVTYTSKETVFGSGRVTVFVEGDVSSVTAAVESIENSNECKIFASYVIANPHEETKKLLEKSKMKYERRSKV
jgi:microcompartment protein CcmL/EutN